MRAVLTCRQRDHTELRAEVLLLIGYYEMQGWDWLMAAEYLLVSSWRRPAIIRPGPPEEET